MSAWGIIPDISSERLLKLIREIEALKTGIEEAKASLKELEEWTIEPKAAEPKPTKKWVEALEKVTDRIPAYPPSLPYLLDLLLLVLS